MHFSQSLFPQSSLLEYSIHHNFPLVLLRALVERVDKIQAKIQVREMPHPEGGSSRAGILIRGHSAVAGAR